MFYFKLFTLTGLLCLFFFSCVEKELIRTTKSISIPIVNESDTIMISPRPGYIYVVNVQMDTIRGPQPIPQPGPPIMIPTQPGYMYDVRIFMDTIRNPPTPPIPGPGPMIFMSSGQEVGFSDMETDEGVNINFSPTLSDMDTIRIEVYNPVTGESDFISCLPGDSVWVPCSIWPGGGRWLTCGSYAVCADTTGSDNN
jgi:hypothetical protein